MRSAEVLTLYDQLVNGNVSSDYLNSFIPNPAQVHTVGARPNSYYVGGAGRGDEGKGFTALRLQHRASKNGKIASVGMRYSGGNNTGHEVTLKVGGQEVNKTNHNLPVAVYLEGATAMIARRVLLHPNDFQVEVKRNEKPFGRLPGNIVIDDTTVLATDCHRALESAVKSQNSSGKGSTNTGIGFGYASLSEKIALRMRDLLDDNWEDTFRSHYHLYQSFTRGFEGFEDLSKVEVTTLPESEGEKNKKRTVGTEEEFIDRLAENRKFFIEGGYVSPNFRELLQEVWDNPNTPFFLEGTQAVGLETDFGLWPDTTAGLVSARDIFRPTYGIIPYEDIDVKLGILKPYLSAVGSAEYPNIPDEEIAQWIRTEFNEYGKTSGRPRGIVQLAVPMLRALRQYDGYSLLGITHMDTSKPEKGPVVITHYQDKRTDEEKPYFPDQQDMDKLKASGVQFPGWDPLEFKGVKKFKDAPHNARVFTSFLSKTVAPVALQSFGTGMEDFITVPGLLPD